MLVYATLEFVNPCSRVRHGNNIFHQINYLDAPVMQNAQIWKSIEALCNEAESVIKNGEPVITVIKSVAPPALACQSTLHKKTVHILSSKPAPPTANIGDRPTQKENVVDAPLSPATMTEIAAAIDRASQSLQTPQILEQPSQEMNDKLRKDLMIEVSLAIRSVLEKELPKMVRGAISESLFELINSSTDPVISGSVAPKANASPRGKNKKINSENKTATKKTSRKKDTTKKTTNKMR
jgi:hypothetical protein